MDTKKKRTPNQKRKAIVSVLLMVAILITGAFAFLSATDSKTNVFTVGNVKIKLSEEFDTNQNGSIEKTNDENDEVYDASETQVSLKGEILPGQKVIKRPYVENTGKNKAWVYITVGIPTTNSDNTFRNKDTGETSITGQNVDIPIQAYAIQENYANKTTYKDVWNAYFANKVTDTFGAEVTDAKTLSERVPLFEILNKTRFNEPTPDNISVDDNIPNDEWENIGITVNGQEKSYYKSANYDYYVFAYKTLLDPTADGAEQLSRTSDVFEGVRLLKDIGEAQPSKLNYYVKESIAGDTLNGEVDLSVEPSTYEGYKLIKTEYYMPGERVRNLYYDDTLAETGYSFNWNFMNDKTKSAYSGMIITEDTDLVATYKDTVSDDSKEPTEDPVVKYSPSGYLGYTIEQNDDGSYYATLIGADETRSDYPSDPTEVIVPSHIKVLENSDGTKLLEKGVVMHGSIDNFSGGTQIPVKKIQLAEWQWDSSTMNYAAPEAVALGKIAKKLNIAGSNIEEIKFCGDIYQHNLTSGFVLEDVGTLPSSLTTLNDKAFYSCVNLKNATMPNFLTNIGYSAFENCSNLEQVTMHNSISSIRESAFKNCGNLKEIVLSTELLTIQDSVFKDCQNLLSVGIPESVTSIGNYAFEGCNSLKTATLPNKLESIGAAAFHWCYNLSNAVIPNTVQTISRDAFSMTGIEYINIPNSVKSIETQAFSGCNNLKEVVIGKGTTNIERDAFSWCNSLLNIKVDSENLNYASKDGLLYTKDFSELLLYPTGNTTENVILPEGLRVLSENTFANNSNIKSITIPSTVEKIDSGFIYQCYEVESIKVNSENKIYDSRNDCNAVIETATNKMVMGCKNTIIPQDIITIGKGALGVGAGSPYEVTLPNSLVKVEENGLSVYQINIPSIDFWFNLINEGASGALYINGKPLTSITIPEGITEIKKGIISEQQQLTNVVIPQSVTNIGDYAFSGCSGLTNITISDSVTSIGNSAFFSCISLTSIAIPDSVTSIGDYAFENCNGLKSITIGSGVTNIGNHVFYGCAELNINVSDKNTVYDSRNNCNAIIETATNTLIEGCKDTKIPDSITSIGNGAFYNCQYLTDIIIPDSVTSIGQNAFSYCGSLTSVTIPDSITSIGYRAFADCNSLSTIIYQGTVFDWAKVDCPPETFASGLTITCTDGTVTTQ